jgi:hypothetical protein
VLLGALASMSALAGQRPYAYVQGAESLPQTGLELESWFGASRASVGSPSAWDWWLGPVVGVTDKLELALYAIFIQPPSTQAMDLRSFRLQASYLLADRGSWPLDVRVRLELGQPVGPHPYTGWAWLIASRDWGSFNATLNGSFWVKFPGPSQQELEPYADYLAGVSYQFLPGIRLGAELEGEAELTADAPQATLSLGPALAAGTGRIWAAASYDWGVTRHSPGLGRLVLGLAF